MNAKQLNKLDMFNEVQVFLNTTAATAGLTAVLAPLGAKLNAYITRINELAAIQAVPTGGPIEVRDQAEEAAIKLTLKIAVAVVHFARANQRPELAVLVDITRRDFEAVRKSERMRLAQRILNAAQPFATELLPYTITPAMFTELQAKIQANTAALSAPRTTVADRKLATTSLLEVFDQADTVIKEIDQIMTLLPDSETAASARYKIARQVIDRPGARTRDGEAPPPAAPAGTTTPAATTTVPKAA